ncbi:MAG TPA: dihydrofolate reductase family protein [Candidatus Thermoplasmatota archaeon]|nr:dihydrofolate reductase family protein [Candidatus Thermoplasmatota archaeon]
MAVRVHVNFAMSLDGCIGLPGPRPLALSGPEDLKRVHELRAASDAILVGVGTVLADDPKLTIKPELVGKRAKNPMRVVLDAGLRTPPKARILNADAPTVIFTGKKGGALPPAEIVPVASDQHGFLDLEEVLVHLEKRRVKKLMVEGGATTLSSFLRSGLVDELTVYVAPSLVGLPGAPRAFVGETMDLDDLTIAEPRRVGAGALLRWTRA